MKQIIILLVLAGGGFAAWKFWPEIKEQVGDGQANHQKNGVDPDSNPAPVDPSPVDPAPTDPAPVDPAASDPASADPATTDPPADPVSKLAAEATFSWKRAPGGKTIFHLGSNLPAGTKFKLEFVTATNMDTMNGALDADGSYTSEAVTVPTGRFEVRLATLPLGEQPDAVQRLMGENGANLAGPLAVDDSLQGLVRFELGGRATKQPLKFVGVNDVP